MSIRRVLLPEPKKQKPRQSNIPGPGGDENEVDGAEDPNEDEDPEEEEEGSDTEGANHGRCRPLPRKTKFIRKRYLHMGVEAGLTGQSPGLLPGLRRSRFLS